MKKMILLIMVFIGCLRIGYAQPGKLDPLFGNNGIVRTNFGSYYSTAIQGDGKIVVVGAFTSGSFDEVNDFAIARYNTDGTLDTDFSQDGKDIITTESIYDIAHSVAIQADGKIIVAGVSESSLTLVRYNSDGTLDTTFSADGKQTTNFGIDYSSVYSVATQSDGKIIISSDKMVGRFNANGTLDSTFSGDGKQIIDFSGYFRGNSVTLQSNGKIMVAGTVGNINPNFALARLNTDGTFDATFSGDGKQTTDLGGEDYAFSLALQADGKILVAGTAYTAGYVGNFALARYNRDGSLDPTFSGDGKQTIDLGYDDEARSVAIQSDGKIVVGGGSNADFAIVRLNTNGSLDSSFNGNGRQITFVGGASKGINSIAIFKDYLYAVGSEYSGNLGIVGRYFLAANKAPIVSITSPANNAVYYAPANINISATASDPGGAIKNVKFYNGSTWLSTDSINPYSLSWKNVAAGTYYLKAKATDNFGLSTTSTTVKVTVLPNKAPVVSITSPANNSVYTAPGKINITASAYDPDGTIKNVKFYRGTTLLKTDSVSPYSYYWTNVVAGNYYLTAKATDNRGVSTTSTVVKVSVAAARPTITSINEVDVDGPPSIKLYPNPVGNILNIVTSGLQANKTLTLSVVSASGVIIKTVQSNSSNKREQMDVTSLKSGVYILKGISGDTTISMQFVKL